MNSRGFRSKREEPLTKEYILSRVAEEELLSHYLGLNSSILPKGMFCSPLREDKRPTCRFYRDPEGIFLKDFSGDFYGDVFNVVQRLHNCDFKQSLSIINQDFLIRKRPEKINYTKQVQERKSRVKRSREIKVKRREWNVHDKNYWGKFHLTSKDLEFFSIAPVEYVWVDEELNYTYRAKDLAYAYYFGQGKFKIYFPLRDTYRFLSNGPHLQGWSELDMTTDLIIFTKSLKDVAVLRKIGYSSLATHNESSLISHETISLVRNYDKLILYDNDEVGIKWAIENSVEHNIPYNYLDVRNGIKDTSDLAKEVGLDQTKEIIDNLVKNKKHGKKSSSIQQQRYKSSFRKL